MTEMPDMSLACAACEKKFVPDTDSLWTLDIVECDHCRTKLKVHNTETYDRRTNVETVDFYTEVLIEH